MSEPNNSIKLVTINDGSISIPVRCGVNYFPHIGCIFIHIPKCGGTSISSALAQIDQFFMLDGVQPKYGGLRRRFHNKHSKATEYVEKFERDIWQRSFKIALVRNPWAQMVSCYFWWLQKAQQWQKNRKDVDAVRRLGSFDAFLRSKYGSEHLNEWRGNPEDWFQDRRGKDLVDHIAKLEDPAPLFARIGQVSRLPNALQIYKWNATDHAHYSTYYTDEGIERVAQRFHYVIHRFGYTFEDQRARQSSGGLDLGDTTVP